MSAAFKLNLKGFRELRTSPAVDAENERLARRVAAIAGPGYVAKKAPSQNRSRWVVVPDTIEAVVDNARHNTLVRALGQVR